MRLLVEQGYFNHGKTGLSYVLTTKGAKAYNSMSPQQIVDAQNMFKKVNH
jgi:hypothetical protein